MAVPTAITDLSATISSNVPADTEQRTTADDYIRALSAFIRQNYDTLVGGQFVFPATQNASTNANTLDDYEEGTFTPVDGSGASLTFTTAEGRYVKVGKMVHVQLHVVYPATASGVQAYISGVPFNTVTSTCRASLAVGYSNGVAATGGLLISNGSSIAIYTNSTPLTNANMSEADIYLSGSYEASA